MVNGKKGYHSHTEIVQLNESHKTSLNNHKTAISTVYRSPSTETTNFVRTLEKVYLYAKTVTIPQKS